MTEKTEDKPRVIAVAMKELAEWGCPYCGFQSGHTPISGNGAVLWVCGECQKSCVALSDGVTQSRMGLGTGVKDEYYYPGLQDHPRRGTPKHGKPDVRPDGGGEFFRSRGMGIDRTPGCFICGGEMGNYHNISGFVQCKAAGERVVALFETGARLDYREHEPDYVQVKIGACNEHKERLMLLHEATEKAGGVITNEMIIPLFESCMSGS